MIKFFHHLLNPHCPECALERQEARVCESCETLRLEIERLRIENARLLDRILEKPKEEPRTDTSDLKPILPRNMPWNVRKQILENESREQAKIMREQAKSPAISTEDLEKELGIAEEARVKG